MYTGRDIQIFVSINSFSVNMMVNMMLRSKPSAKCVHSHYHVKKIKTCVEKIWFHVLERVIITHDWNADTEDCSKNTLGE